MNSPLQEKSLLNCCGGVEECELEGAWEESILQEIERGWEAASVTGQYVAGKSSLNIG